MAIFGQKRRRLVPHAVEVLALHHLDGTMTPVQINWDDGRRLEISRSEGQKGVTHPSFPNPVLEYKITIRGQERKLFYSSGMWFVLVEEE